MIDEAISLAMSKLIHLESFKSKDELIGEIISLLQSPAKNVLSGLKVLAEIRWYVKNARRKSINNLIN